MAYLSILDGVRTVAVLLVVLCHLLLQVWGGKEPGFYSFRAMGHLGVAIFFVHTTFVLLASLQRHGSAVIPFYIRRVFRIYPLAMALILFIALLQLAVTSPIDTGRMVSNLLLVQNLTGDQPYIGPLWSLPYEVQMYLALPVLYAAVTRTSRPVLWGVLLYVAAVALAAMDAANLADFHTPGVSPSLLRFAPCFTAGALAFALAGRVPKVLPPAALALVLAGIIGAVPWLSASGLPEAPLMWAVCLILGIAIPASSEVTCRPVAITFKTVATYSYGVYLMHVFALEAIAGLMSGPEIMQWTAMLVLLAGLPYICYHGIEKRGVALGARLAERYAIRSERQDLRGAAGGDQPFGL